MQTTHMDGYAQIVPTVDEYLTGYYFHLRSRDPKPGRVAATLMNRAAQIHVGRFDAIFCRRTWEYKASLAEEKIIVLFPIEAGPVLFFAKSGEEQEVEALASRLVGIATLMISEPVPGGDA